MSFFNWQGRTLLFMAAVCGLTLAWPVSTQAKRVEPEKARSLAQKFAESKRGQADGRKAKTDVRLKYAAKQTRQPIGSRKNAQGQGAADDTLYYVFNINDGGNGGFVIVAGDDAVKPVLGYSDGGLYDPNNIPPNFAYWMEYLGKQIAYAQEHGVAQDESVRREWESYLAGGASLMKKQSGDVVVEPLIDTKWNQDAPFNSMTPTDNGVQTLTGCAATAVAQFMKYYNHPAQGTGQSEAYTTTSGINVPSKNFSTVSFDWKNMKNTYNSNSTTAQKNAVAALMYYVGVSMKMDYSATNSNGGGMTSALRDYFGYEIVQYWATRKDYDDASWEAMLREQLDAGDPVLYEGHGGDGGHVFICDGYDNTGKFHFNWGWGGYSDGYFVTAVLNPNSGSSIRSYSDEQGASRKIKIKYPDSEVIGVTDVLFNRESAIINVDETVKLKPSVLPAVAANKNVTCNSSNPAVATVDDNGVVTGVSEGNATITVTTEDGAKTANCPVTVIGASGATYVITGSGTSFTAKLANVTVGTANKPIQNIIDAIQESAAGNKCTIQFGNGTGILDIGTEYIEFVGNWGMINLTGKLTASNSNFFPTIGIGRDISINVAADIEHTKIPLVFDGFGGTITVNAGTIAGNIHGNLSVTINGGTIGGIISGDALRGGYGNGSTTVNGGTISDGIRVLDGSSAIINGGIVSSKNGAAVKVEDGGSATIIGGVVFSSFTTCGAANNVITGNYTASGDAVIMSACGIKSNAIKRVLPSSTADISVLPAAATAFWDVVGGLPGISYANGANVGFIPVDGVAVGDVSVLGSDRTIPNNTASVTLSVSPPSKPSAASFTVGPNPAASRPGVISFYWSGASPITSGTLHIYDASGNAVKKLPVRNKSAASGNVIASWDMTAKKGVPVSDGTYLVRGVVKTKDGKSERVSAVVGVR